MSDTRIQVYGGTSIDPLNPTEDEINIESIAHSLAHQCRFAGHLDVFYSVAEHSVRVSEVVPQEDKLWGLLHDASEAYLVDVPSPLKNALFGDQYKRIEKNLMKVITTKYGLQETMPDSVLRADNSLLGTEARDLLNTGTDELFTSLWKSWLHEPVLPNRIIPLQPKAAKSLFLAHFYTLEDQDGESK